MAAERDRGKGRRGRDRELFGVAAAAPVVPPGRGGGPSSGATSINSVVSKSRDVTLQAGRRAGNPRSVPTERLIGSLAPQPVGRSSDFHPVFPNRVTGSSPSGSLSRICHGSRESSLSHCCNPMPSRCPVSPLTLLLLLLLLFVSSTGRLRVAAAILRLGLFEFPARRRRPAAFVETCARKHPRMSPWMCDGHRGRTFTVRRQKALAKPLHSSR